MPRFQTKFQTASPLNNGQQNPFWRMYKTSLNHTSWIYLELIKDFGNVYTQNRLFLECSLKIEVEGTMCLLLGLGADSVWAYQLRDTYIDRWIAMRMPESICAFALRMLESISSFALRMLWRSTSCKTGRSWECSRGIWLRRFTAEMPFDDRNGNDSRSFCNWRFQPASARNHLSEILAISIHENYYLNEFIVVAAREYEPGYNKDDSRTRRNVLHKNVAGAIAAVSRP